MSFVVAIDGPGGAGKSTVARKVAKRLEYIYIDTGAMYRSVALYCIETFISLSDEEKISNILDEIDIDIKYIDHEQRIILNDIDVTREIRTPSVAEGSSKVAALESVRKKLVAIQRNLAKDKNVIMDGRDIGTFVVPNAQVKIFLTASVDIRAKRRLKEMVEKGEKGVFEEIKEQIIKRDERDINRKISPLKKADDAILLDTSNYSEEEVIEHVIALIKRRQENGSNTC